MVRSGGVRRSATLVLSWWLLAACAAAAHDHEDGVDRDHDHAPCSVCIAIHHVPSVAPVHVETHGAEPVVVLWISRFSKLVPDEALFDRPLARGPPTYC